MDKEELGKYRALKREVEQLEDRINKLCAKSDDIPVVKGKVKASSPAFPYTEHRVSVQMSLPEAADRISRLMRIYERRKEEAEEAMLRIEQYISSIADSEIRQIFQMRFIDGMKQEIIAKNMKMDRSSVSKKINAYLKVSHNSQKNVI